MHPKPCAPSSSASAIAQTLHALSAEGSERARDLVDLQLLERREDLDLATVVATCARLFRYRQQHEWPPTSGLGATWDTLYLEAAEGLEVRPTVENAVRWVNDSIQRMAAASMRLLEP